MQMLLWLIRPLFYIPNWGLKFLAVVRGSISESCVHFHVIYEIASLLVGFGNTFNVFFLYGLIVGIAKFYMSRKRTQF